MQNHYIVFDLEATCWEGFQRRNLSEIVEIGALKFDVYGQRLGRFHSFVKPVFHPHLSPYFLRLTGIAPEDVLGASGFKEVYHSFFDWVYADSDEVLLCAWGKDDFRFLQSNLQAHRLPLLSPEMYLDVKAVYNDAIRRMNGKPSGLIKALHQEGFEFDGRQHRAFDDAYNLSKLFVKHIDEWQRYKRR